MPFVHSLTNLIAMSVENKNNPSAPDWNGLAANPAFQDLLKRKARFIIISCVFFMVYYFALPISVGYWPSFMKQAVLGKVNIAYLFALSQFFMAWALAFIYLRKAGQWDKEAKSVLDNQ